MVRPNGKVEWYANRDLMGLPTTGTPATPSPQSPQSPQLPRRGSSEDIGNIGDRPTRDMIFFSPELTLSEAKAWVTPIICDLAQCMDSSAQRVSIMVMP